MNQNKEIMRYKFILLFGLLFFSPLCFFLFFQLRQAENNLLETKYISSPSLTATIPNIPPLTLEMIFSPNHSWVNRFPSEKTINLIATGDVILARSVNYQSIKINDFHWSFAKTRDILENADLSIINLESPLIPSCPVVNSGMVFCGNEKNIEGLTFAGIDVATLENNHINNYGTAGIKNTIKLLNNSGIKVVRENYPQLIDIKDKKIAILAYNDLANPQIATISSVEEKIASDVKTAKNKSDIVIVAFHWGTEYTEQPSKRQKMLAHLIIDNGADLILGNHPHWIEPVEIYKSKLIVYAHGNFIFDQMWSEKTKQGVVGHYTFYDGQLIDAQFLPVYIKDYGQPYFLEGEEKENILNNMKLASKKNIGEN